MAFLTLHRYPGQALLIGNTILLTVQDIVDGQVEISIEARRDVLILREELATSKQIREAFRDISR